ncbi:MAG: Metallophosphoesterase [Chlorobi bacterium]|nr:Metallophosphoesterase [Chlorobiota bacterium]
MPFNLSLHLLQLIAVAVIVAFHWLAARGVLRLIDPARRALRRNLRLGFIALIILLDLPLAHLFVFYKDFHPKVLDTLLHDFVGPFLALHANAALFGGGILLHRYFIAPVVRWLRRQNHVPAKPAVHLEDASGTAPAAELPLADGPRIIPARRRFLYTAGMAAAGYVTSASALSAMEGTTLHRLERVVIKVPNLPEGLKGTTIAMISDIHSSVFMTREEMDIYVRALNRLGTDFTVVVGDFVNSKLVEVYPFAESFAALKAPLGVYGVTGNHDYYTNDIERVVKEVEQCGIRVLRNENLTIEKNGEKLWLLGMDDTDIYDVKPYLETGRSPRGTIENILRGIPDGAPKLFLCHKPYPFEEFSQLGMDLMLSGHTHGGQVVIGQLDNVNLSFASLASNYVAGLYRAQSNRRSQLYVSRGVGTVGLPLRLNCPPEITHITLV